MHRTQCLPCQWKIYEIIGLHKIVIGFDQKRGMAGIGHAPLSKKLYYFYLLGRLYFPYAFRVAGHKTQILVLPVICRLYLRFRVVLPKHARKGNIQHVNGFLEIFAVLINGYLQDIAADVRRC